MTKKPGHCFALFLSTEVSMPIFLLNLSNFKNLIIPKKAEIANNVATIESTIITCWKFTYFPVFTIISKIIVCNVKVIVLF